MISSASGFLKCMTDRKGEKEKLQGKVSFLKKLKGLPSMHFSELGRKKMLEFHCRRKVRNIPLLWDVVFSVEPCGDLQAVTESSCAEN